MSQMQPNAAKCSQTSRVFYGCDLQNIKIKTFLHTETSPKAVAAARPSGPLQWQVHSLCCVQMNFVSMLCIVVLVGLCFITPVNLHSVVNLLLDLFLDHGGLALAPLTQWFFSFPLWPRLVLHCVHPQLSLSS